MGRRVLPAVLTVMAAFADARGAHGLAFDALLGAIPWVGAIPDFFFRSNSRNLKIIRRHLDRHHPATATIEAERIER
jgi:hypothetical protein